MPAALLLSGVLSMSAVGADHGFVQLESKHDVASTLERLERSFKQHGPTVFARIGFSSDAERAGLAMRPEVLLLFGNPKAGTPLMQAVPARASTCPSRRWSTRTRTAGPGSSTTRAITSWARHGVPQEHAANIAGASRLIEQAARGD